MESNVTEFSLEKYNTCAVQKGALKCWGDIPSILSDELNLVSNVELVSAHGINTCISEKTIFKCLGFNMYGQLGVGTKEPVLKFQKINGLEQEVKQFKISYRHSCAIQRGALKCWGDNKYGQLGTSLWKIKELQKL
ncbi:MAG: hypothetical protein OXN83_06310 [Oligoflexia bacterium]|nr:hypothetical protein [Oligoflexia bacterium]